MATTESLENANKITMELIVHGFLRLYVLQHSTSSDIPLKVFNVLLSTMICTDIQTCSILSNCLDILKQYDEWVNIDKKAKSRFVCNIPYHASPFELISSYFEHISNLHGLTYHDYDKLNAFCKSKVYNKSWSGSPFSVLNECLPSHCAILNEEQKQELAKLTQSTAQAHHTAIQSRSLEETEDFTVYTNYEGTIPFSKQKSLESTYFDTEDASEAADHFPEDLSMGKHFNKQSSFGSRSFTISTVTQLLTPSWTVHKKLQKHISTGSGGDISQFMSQISVLSLLPTISDVEQEPDSDDDDDENDHRIIDKANRSGILLPPTPDSPNLGVSMKSYRFIFDAINLNDEDSIGSIGYRQIAEISVNPFDLLPMMSETAVFDASVKNPKKHKKYEYELRTQLQNILNEMDLMGEGRLDVAGLGTALTSLIKDLDYDLMEISMKIFDDNGLCTDDMDSAAIDDIIEYIVNSDDIDIVKLREKICDGLDIKYDEEEEEEIKSDAELNDLVLKEKEQTDEPYKPMYAVTNAIQRFGNNSDLKKKKKENENKENNDDSDLHKLKIIKSVKDDAVTDILDKIHIYLFHAVHDIKQIPL